MLRRGGAALAFSGALLLAGALLAGACASSPPVPRGKVLVIALDGATWRLIDPLIAEGRLPNLAKLRDAGASGPLESIEPTLSPVVFTTIATGRKPEDHGILRFVRKDRQGHEISFTNSDRRARALWNILDDLGARSTVVGWFTSWPADIVKGSFISDRNEGPLAGGQSPESLSEMLERTSRAWPEGRAVSESARFLGPEFDAARFPEEDRRSWKSIEESLDHYYRVDSLRLEWAESLMHAGQTDLTAVFFKGTDPVSHIAWVYMDPASLKGVFDPPPEAVARLGPVIPRYYEWVDDAIGRLVAAADPATDIVVLSDHGFGPSRAQLAYHVNPVLARFGWLAAGPEGRPDVARSLVIDPTPQGKNGRKDRRLVVNRDLLAERAPDAAGRRALVDQIVARLSGLRGDDGQPLFEKVRVTGAEEEAGRLAIDVVISAAFQKQVDEGGHAEIRGRWTADGVGTFPLTDLASFRREHTGQHELQGIVIIAGPHARAGARIEKASVYDIAPTLLRLFGLPASKQMSGRVLDEALNSDMLPPVAGRVETWEREEPIARVPAPEQPEAEEELQERLRTLGYIQ